MKIDTTIKTSSDVELVRKYLNKITTMEGDVQSLIIEIEALEDMSEEQREDFSYGFEGMITFVSVDISYNEALRLFRQMLERKQLELKQASEKVAEFAEWIRESK